jgi:mycothiol system anti-sigma-R factor
MYDCLTVMRLLYPYLDGELEVKESWKVQAHLEECPLCREVFKEEKDYLQVFKRSVSLLPAPAHLREKITEALRPPVAAQIIHHQKKDEAKRPLFTFPRAILAGVTAALVLVITGAILYALPAFHEKKTQRLAKAAVENHVAITDGNGPCDVRSTDPAVILAWLQDRLDFPIVLPHTEIESMYLICGKLVDLPAEKKGALLRFASNDGPITLLEAAPESFLLFKKKATPFNLPLSYLEREAHFQKILLYLDEDTGTYILFCPDPQVHYALVSDNKARIGEACQLCHGAGDRPDNQRI